MTREEATRDLASDAPHTRLKAARALARVAVASDLALLRAALRKESVSFVRRALETAIARVSTGQNARVDDHGAEEPQPDPRAYSRAVEWATTTLLHEILPRLGEVKLEARRSIATYEASGLKKRFDALDGVVEAIGELQKATQSKAITAVNLKELVEEVWTDQSLKDRCAVSLQGSPELTATVDRNLLRLAVCNGMRNAMEATTASGSDAAIVVAWGATDVDLWLTILDHGPGLTSASEAAFQIGSTTKAGHRGFGLAIVRQAMMTLGGTASLSPGVSGGARFELRWPR